MSTMQLATRQVYDLLKLEIEHRLRFLANYSICRKTNIFYLKKNDVAFKYSEISNDIIFIDYTLYIISVTEFSDRSSNANVK